MRTKWIRAVFLLSVMAVLGAAVAGAQTDVSASVYGAFTGTTTGHGTVQSPSNSAGGLIEVRHVVNPIIGFEATYAFNSANQIYSASSFASQSVSAKAHEVTADWVSSLKVGNFTPFGLVGIGVLLDVPGSGQNSVNTTAKPVYVYGAGVDWGILPHVGLRFQYRGNLYSAPNLTTLYTSTSAFTHTAEPMVGVFFRL